MMSSFESGLKGLSTIIFIVGAGGAFKEIILKPMLVNIANLMTDTNICLIMAWLITALINATGQGVVSDATAELSVLILFQCQSVLMVLATATGSNTIRM